MCSEVGCALSNINSCFVCGEKYEASSLATQSEIKYMCSKRCAATTVESGSRRLNSMTRHVDIAVPPMNRTMLHSAVLAGDPSLVWLLLLRGANPFARDALGITPIDLARQLLGASFLNLAELTGSLCSNRISIVNMLPKYSFPLSSKERHYSDLPGKPPGLVSVRSDVTGANSLPMPPPSHARSQSEAITQRDMLGYHTTNASTTEKTADINGMNRQQRNAMLATSRALLSGQLRFSPVALVRVVSDGDVLDTVCREFIGKSEEVSGQVDEEKDIKETEWTSYDEELLAVQCITRQILTGCDTDAVGATLNLHGAATATCAVCLETCGTHELPLAYHCTKESCGTCLCQTCLYGLVCVVIKDSLYAVPPVRCPGTCRGRVPSSTWSRALQGMPMADSDLSSFRNTVGDRDVVLESLDEANARFEYCCARIMSSGDDSDKKRLLKSYCDLLQSLLNLCYYIGCRLERFYDKIIHCSETLCFGWDDSMLQTLPDDIEITSFATFVQNLHPAIPNPTNGDDGCWDNVDEEYQRVAEGLGKIMQVEESHDDEGVVDNCDLYMEGLFETFAALGVFGRVVFGMRHIETMEFEIPYMLRGECSKLFLRKYRANANALLMYRCSECDDTHSLFVTPCSTSEDGQLAVDMMWENSDILYYSEGKLRARFKVLQELQRFCDGDVPADVFITDTFATAYPKKAGGLDVHYEEGTLPRDLQLFFTSLLSLIPDIERRVTAQLAMLRIFPKIMVPCCQRAFCFMCKVMTHHPESTCEELQQSELGVTCQYCPGCGVPSLRSEGCSSIYCVCGTYWTWQEEDDGEELF
jgi:hypothetical protein